MTTRPEKIAIALYGQPVSVNKLYRGRRFLTNEGKRIKFYNAAQAKGQYQGEVLKGPIRVQMEVYFKSKASSDIDNVCKAMLDSLTGVIWKDDRQIQELHVWKNQDKENPRVEVEVITLK